MPIVSSALDVWNPFAVIGILNLSLDTRKGFNLMNDALEDKAEDLQMSETERETDEYRVGHVLPPAHRHTWGRL